MNDVQIELGNYIYRVDGDRLSISRGTYLAAEFRIAPSLDGQLVEIESWSRKSGQHYCASLVSGGTLHLTVELNRLCLQLEAAQPFIRELTLLSDGRFAGNHWHSFVPDEWDRTWDSRRDIAIAASSCYIGMNVDDKGAGFEPDGAGMTDPGDLVPTWIFNVPAHMAAFQVNDEEWAGICMPLPHAIGAVRYDMDRERFRLRVDTVQASCPENGCPKIYFETGLSDPYQLCDRHYALSEQLGLTRGRVTADHPAWWGHPYYKSYDDQLRMEQEEGGYVGHFKEVDGKQVSALTAERFKNWHAAVEEKTDLVGRVNTFFDQVYFARYGDYREINPELGGVDGFRAMIDEWRSRGVHTGLYFHLYTISKDSDFYKQHPEACLEPNSPDIVYTHGVQIGSAGVTFLDWTHPAARQFMLNNVTFLLSDKPGCLNADWLAINNNVGPDPRWYEFHDPDWGTGDLMQRKVQQLVYEHAKSIKSDCLVRRQSAMAPYMEPYYDEAQLCEEWNGSTDAWWRRARIATRLIRHNIVGFDPWFVTLTKGYEYYQGLAAVCVPATEASSHAIHPYVYHRPLKEKDYRRRKAGMQAYMNAPQSISDDKHVELTSEGAFVTAWRKYTEGPLTGFYAALAISPRGLVTFSPTQALISAAESRTADIPLPPNARLVSVDRVQHDGGVQEHAHELIDGPAVRLHVEDAAGPTMHVRIRYELMT